LDFNIKVVEIMSSGVKNTKTMESSGSASKSEDGQVGGGESGVKTPRAFLGVW
jgi:hypothetical protein